MPKITFIDPEQHEHVAKAGTGQNAMEAAVGALVPGIEASCGGNCICGTCHCHVDEAWLNCLPPADAAEQAMTEATNEPRPDSRLACQIEITEELDGLLLRVATSQH